MWLYGIYMRARVGELTAYANSLPQCRTGPSASKETCGNGMVCAAEGVMYVLLGTVVPLQLV